MKLRQILNKKECEVKNIYAHPAPSCIGDVESVKRLTLQAGGKKTKHKGGWSCGVIVRAFCTSNG